jgi:Zn-dependent M28 family amino/carboxypeptidase
MIKCIAVLSLALLPLSAQPGSEAISAARIREHTRFLSSDLLEGRGVGQRGGDIASQYLATGFALAGAQPAGDKGTFFQSVPMVGVETLPSATLSASSGGRTISLKWLDEFVGVNEEQKTDSSLDAEAVFVGHGISAPEFNWDDYKGVDVKGKVVVLFTNEPASNDPKFFEGRSLTYYGRWSYKYEEATRRGARAVLIIHTTPTAGYAWDVVRNSWGVESPFMKLEPGAGALALQGWITREAAEKMLALSSRNVDELLAASERRDFHPIPLGIRVAAHMLSKVRPIESRNVAALVPGSDPVLRNEVVIFSAHWDHLGIGAPVDGDRIYNGAVDNATGCAILLELARVWAAQPLRPRRSALFLAVTGEEGGLRGSEWYATHPLFPPAKSALALNYDGLFPWGRVNDIVITGAERTTVYPLAEQIAKRLKLTITPDPTPEQGHYFRSDHFSFAHVGIPAFSVEHGTDFSGRSKEWGAKKWQEYNDKHYHQPSDEFREDWDFTDLQQLAEYGYLIARDVANQDRPPGWRPGDSFHR